MACMLVLLIAPAVHAAELADGTYTIDYVIKKAEDESVSMANDYWEKPAKLIVENGKLLVQTKINHSAWVTQFKVPGGSGYVDTKVVATDKAEDTRVAQFAVAGLEEAVLSKIHVTVESIDYDHDYTIRIVFDKSSLKLVQKAPEPSKSAPQESAAGSSTPAPAATATPRPVKEPEKAAASSQPEATPTPAASDAASATKQPAASGTKNGQESVQASPSATPSAQASKEPEATPEEVSLESSEPALEEPTVQAEQSQEKQPALDSAGAEGITAGADIVKASMDLAAEQEADRTTSRWLLPSITGIVVLIAFLSWVIWRKSILKNK
ncbi:heme uptake protein IsdC [Paenibacillus sp. NPDC057967]|uniref:heme uptake protein IsdC n=1 Tax=Paenibacillus sp. NPDC057967 TaxID=3346293 RepID=UPI0036DBA243